MIIRFKLITDSRDILEGREKAGMNTDTVFGIINSRLAELQLDRNPFALTVALLQRRYRNEFPSYLRAAFTVMAGLCLIFGRDMGERCYILLSLVLFPESCRKDGEAEIERLADSVFTETGRRNLAEGLSRIYPDGSIRITYVSPGTVRRALKTLILRAQSGCTLRDRYVIAVSGNHLLKRSTFAAAESIRMQF